MNVGTKLGCLTIMMAFSVFGCQDGLLTDAPTWYGEIEPLVNAHCAECHHDGGIGPFNLTDSETAQSMSAIISYVVESGIMPPWMPSDECLPLEGSRRLAPWQVDMFVDWDLGGAPLGDITKAEQWQAEAEELEWTSITLTPMQEYLPTGGGERDDYHCFILEPAIPNDVALRAFQVHPGASEIVHHVLLYEVDTQAARALEDVHGEGFTCYGGVGTGSESLVGGWVPGIGVVSFPEGVGLPLSSGRSLVMQVHYNVMAQDPVPDLTTVDLQFAQSPVTYSAAMLGFPVSDIFIPSGEMNHVESDDFIVEADAILWGVVPHMHELGTQISASVVDPNGENEQCLVDIPKWDFNWQQIYMLSDPDGYQVQKDSILSVTCTYDNPTQTLVTWGDSTADEMCLFYAIYSLDE